MANNTLVGLLWEMLWEQFVTPYKVIFDHRYRDSIAFAEAAGKLGVTTEGIRGDITDLWYHDLYHEWKKGPAPIMGMTDDASLFCLQILAQDQGMRVVLRVDHNFLSSSEVEHVITGMNGIPEAAANLCDDGPAWNVRMSDVIMQCPGNRSRTNPTRLVSRLVRQDETQERLVTWVIAPVRKV